MHICPDRYDENHENSIYWTIKTKLHRKVERINEDFLSGINWKIKWKHDKSVVGRLKNLYNLKNHQRLCSSLCLKIPERTKNEVKTMFQLLSVEHLKLKLLKPQNHLMIHQLFRCIHDFGDLQSADNISSVDYNLGCLYLFESRNSQLKMTVNVQSLWPSQSSLTSINQGLFMWKSFTSRSMVSTTTRSWSMIRM